MREPISLAYLLARTSDTIADTAEVPSPIRRRLLIDFQTLVENGAGGAALRRRLVGEFQPYQTKPAERVLLDRVEDCLAWLRSLPEEDRREIRWVLGEILRGQTLDLERFPGSLSSAHELDEYAYLVAGSVGAFWTRIGFAHVSRYASEPEPRMRELGISYGKGLQLVNILRDLPKDLADGRCYLPADECGQAPQLEAVARYWETRCHEHFQNGLRYCQALRGFRLRFATSLPVFLGLKTLAMLRLSTWDQRLVGLKVGRAEVKRILRRAAWASLCGSKAMARLAQSLQTPAPFH